MAAKPHLERTTRRPEDPLRRPLPRLTTTTINQGATASHTVRRTVSDPQAKGVVERLQGFAETNFEPGRRFANEVDFQEQLDGWFVKVNARTHKALRARPADRLADELEVMAPLPERMPGTTRRWVMRIAPDPFLRVDTNDYSLDPRLVGRRIEARVDQREVLAVVLDTGEIACQHQRVFAKHRTITALEHARALRDGRRAPAEPQVEIRPLDRYDQLIA